MKCKRLAAILLVLTAAGWAQPPATSTSATAERALQNWRKSRTAALMDDFSELSRYRNANAALAKPKPGETRVVFYGDSITDFWNLEKFFPGKDYVNRGISGQTTSQMLLRFRQDVVDIGAKVVVILAGTNDIAGNTGPMTLEQTEANFASMAEIARANGIRVIFSSVLPVNNYTPSSATFFALRPPQQIEALNRWLKNYAAEHGDIYLDYYSSMVDENGYLKRAYADDGLHPNAAGYAAMAPLADAAIAKALLPNPGTKQNPATSAGPGFLSF